MGTTKLLFVLFIFSFSQSFVSFPGESKPVNMAGKYGVYPDAEATTQQISLELTLNQDNTFHYIDNTNSDSKIDVSGKWSLYKGDIYLTNYPAGNSIMKIWKTEKDSSCLKSRKGVAYYRICRL